VWHGLPDRIKYGLSSARRLGLALLLVAAVCAIGYLGNGAIQRAFFAGPANPSGEFRTWLRGEPGTGTGLPLLRAALFSLGACVGTWLLPRAIPLDLRDLPGAARGSILAFVYAIVPGLLLLLLAPLVEIWPFGGDFRWFLVGHPDGTGTTFEQTNSLVVGIAMGFAVIPIIYTIAEDALSAIPESLTSAALACGASPWQTATRVVVPAAAPGLFSASMIGLGRAVGETMIVLMATGGTAIMDPSMFNGFRTLSANVATELSEAPRGETLYRVLFLAALLLFVLTFVVNTVAEMVRLRFRRKFKAL
jgi:phosphate transport system permease protein